MPFPPVDFPGVSLEVNGNTGTPSASTTVGDGENVGVSISIKRFLIKGLTDPGFLLLALVFFKVWPVSRNKGKRINYVICTLHT